MCPTVSGKPSEKGERKMNREALERIVREERAAGNRPNLAGMDLRDADLHGADLRDADLYDADLYGADLRGANLRGADLYGTDLRGADLRGADLRGADLYGTNLYGADLYGTNLYGARWGGLEINRLPSGTLHLTPTPEGWHIHLGCWDGTVSELREMIAGDDDWPEAEGPEVEHRRPYIEAALALCELHMKDNNEAIDALAEKWLGERAKEGDE